MNKADNTQFDEKSYVDKQFNILESKRKDIEEEYENGRRNEKNAEELQKLAVQKEEKMKNAVNNYYTQINQKRKEEEDKISKHFENLIDQVYNTMESEKKRNAKEGIKKDWPESVINGKNLEAEKKYNNSLLKIKEEREKINKNKPEKEIKGNIKEIKTMWNKYIKNLNILANFLKNPEFTTVIQSQELDENNNIKYYNTYCLPDGEFDNLIKEMKANNIDIPKNEINRHNFERSDAKYGKAKIPVKRTISSIWKKFGGDPETEARSAYLNAAAKEANNFKEQAAAREKAEADAREAPRKAIQSKLCQEFKNALKIHEIYLKEMEYFLNKNMYTFKDCDFLPYDPICKSEWIIPDGKFNDFIKNNNINISSENMQIHNNKRSNFKAKMNPYTTSATMSKFWKKTRLSNAMKEAKEYDDSFNEYGGKKTRKYKKGKKGKKENKYKSKKYKRNNKTKKCKSNKCKSKKRNYK
jgi:hypothetical protein